MQVRFEESPAGLTLRHAYARGNWGGGVFMVLWLIGWTVGCVLLAGQALKGDLKFILFGIPFWASWFFVAATIIYTFFGRSWLQFTADGVTYRSSAIVPLKNRFVPWVEFRKAARGATSWKKDEAPQHCIKIITLGQPIEFAAGVSSDEAEWLAEQVQRIGAALAPVGSLQRKRGECNAAAKDGDGTGEADWADEADEIGRQEEVLLQDSEGSLRPNAIRHREDIAVLRPVRDRRAVREERAAPPTDSHWRLQREFQSVSFVTRGRWSFSALAVITFLNLFWNGIVGVFIYALITEFQWFLFFFLIPFEVIGLGFFCGWLACLFMPWWTYRVTAERRAIERRWAVLGIGRTRRTEIESLDRIEIRQDEDDSPSPARSGPEQARSFGKLLRDGNFRLLLVDPQNRELLTVGALSEGEALWIGRTIVQERPDWYS
jgi:hypothetical protein